MSGGRRRARKDPHHVGAAEPARLHIVRPGICATIQDLGRPGHGRFGVSPSGAMDPLAHRIANRLLGNADGAATLELTDAGVAIEIQTATTVALAGGDLGATLDGQALPLEGAPVARFTSRPGATLRLTRRRRGARVYLAVPGGFEAPLVFGSAATDLGAALGGLSGRVLRAGDQLLARHPSRRVGALPSLSRERLAALAGLLLPSSHGGGADPVVLRYVPEGEPLLAEAQALFPHRVLTISAQSSRTGFRFRGEPLPAPADADRLSEPTAPGAVQLPPDGLPILLMADRNPTGGYPRLGHLALVDRGLAAQLAPGDQVRFAPVSAAEAVALAREQEARLRAALPGAPLS